MWIIVKDRDEDAFWGGCYLEWNHAIGNIYVDEPIFVPEGGKVKRVWIVEDKWNAVYTSVWDSGATVTTKCVFDPETEDVLEQEVVDVNGIGNCVRECVLYNGVNYEIGDYEEE